jgi:ferredoxin
MDTTNYRRAADVVYFARPTAHMIDDGSFLEHLVPSAASVRVRGDETILVALGRIGIRLPFACQAGTCGICETPVLAGTPHRRDPNLRRGEATDDISIMVCCPRCKKPELTLDL